MKQIYCLIITILLVACNKSTVSVETISITADPDKAITLDENKISKTIELENTADAIISEPCKLFLINNTLVIHSADKVVMFDKEGKFIKNIGSLGHAENEFLIISDTYHIDDTLYIYDAKNAKILKFNNSGDFTGVIKLDNEKSLSKIQPFDNGYIGALTFEGEQNKTPLCGYLDSKFQITKMSHKTLTSGVFIHKIFSKYQNDMLYWNMLNDTIYSINKDMVVLPKYSVNFGKYAISESIKLKSMEEIFQYIITQKPDVVLNPQYVIETDETVSFTFSVQTNKYFAVYHKSSKNTTITKLELKNYLFASSCFMIDEQLIFSCYNNAQTDKNITLVIIDKNKLL